MNVGELKLSLLLDVRPFGESVKTALNILSTFNKSASQSLKFQDPKINLSGIDGEIKKLDSTLKKYKSEVTGSASSNDRLSDSFKRTATVSVNFNDKLQGLFLRFQGIQSVVSILKGTLGDFLGKFNQFQNSLLGLESISQFKGIDPQVAKSTIQDLDLVKSGLLSVSDASTSFKNLLAANFTLEQTTELVNRLGDSAAFGRQESLSFGDAIRSATEGIKNGNSILVDNAGVTKNLSLMLESAGFKAQDLMKAGEDAGVRMAIFNGILGETTGQLGNADKLINSSQGGLIKFEKSINDLKIAFGSIVSTVMPLVTGPLTAINDFIISAPPNVKKAALAFTAVATALVFLNGQLSFTTKGFLLINSLVIGLPTPLKILVGGLALISAGIIAVNGQLTIMNIQLGGIPVLIGLVVTAATAFTSAFGDMSSEITDINAAMDDSKEKISEQTENIDSLITINEALKNGMVLTADQQLKYNQALERVKDVYPEVISAIDKKTGREKIAADVLEDLTKKEKDKLKILKDAQSLTFAEEISDLTDEYGKQKDRIEELNYKLKDGAKILKEDFDWNLNPFESFEDHLKSTSAELINVSKEVGATREKIIKLFTTGIENNVLLPLLDRFNTKLGESGEASDLLRIAIDNMASNLIERFKNIAQAGESLVSVFHLITLAQQLMQTGREMGSTAMFNRGQEIMASVRAEYAKLEALQKNAPAPKTTSKSGKDKNQTEKEKIDLLEEYNKKLKETEEIITDIRGKLKDTNLRPDEIEFLLSQLDKYTKILEEHKIIKNKPIDVDERKRNIDEEEKKAVMKFDIDLEKFNKAHDIASQIQGIFQFGSHTLLGKFLAALQVTQQIVALLQSLQLAQGVFNFLSKAFGIVLAPVTGGASLAGAGGLPPSGNVGNLPERFGQSQNFLNKSNIIVEKEPYFVSIKADGRELKAVIRQVDKVDNARIK